MCVQNDTRAGYASLSRAIVFLGAVDTGKLRGCGERGGERESKRDGVDRLHFKSFAARCKLTQSVFIRLYAFN